MEKFPTDTPNTRRWTSSELSRLAEHVQQKFMQEVSRPDNNLRFVVGHANTLDGIVLLLNTALEEEERFNQQVKRLFTESLQNVPRRPRLPHSKQQQCLTSPNIQNVPDQSIYSYYEQQDLVYADEEDEDEDAKQNVSIDYPPSENPFDTSGSDTDDSDIVDLAVDDSDTEGDSSISDDETLTDDSDGEEEAVALAGLSKTSLGPSYRSWDMRTKEVIGG